MSIRSVRIIGPGRAGRSFADALRHAGLDVDLRSRAADAGDAASGVDLVLLCVPDGHIGEVAARVAPADAVVAHVSGSRTLDVLAPHRRRCSIHPLMSLPAPDVGAARLADHCHFAIAGASADDVSVAAEIVALLGGSAVRIDDADRARYHAAASVAANHLVVLCAQVDRIARELGAPPAAFWRLMETTLDNVAEATADGESIGSVLTGPAARGDWATVTAHLDALPEAERALYVPFARSAAELAGRNWPEDL